MTTARSAGFQNTLLIAGGLAAGFMNGLLGAGGGILIVFVLGQILKPEPSQASLDFDRRDIFACALAAMLPMSVVSVISYAVQGTLSLEGAEKLILPAIVGGVGGAFLLDHMKTETVRKIFAVIVIYSGIAMLLK